MTQTPIKFITFEGGEGSGKSTQIALLKEYLIGCGQTVVQTREPGGTPLAEKLRTVLLEGVDGDFDPLSEHLIISAARRSHCCDLIQPTLARGDWVLSDRYIDSSWVYQTFVQGLSSETMDYLNDTVVGDLIPTLTFLLDCSPMISKTRMQGRQQFMDRYDSKPMDFHEKVRQGFLKRAENTAAQGNHRFVVIDGSQSIDVIAKVVQGHIQKIWEI